MFFAPSSAPIQSIRSAVRAGVIVTAIAAALAHPAPSVAQDKGHDKPADKTADAGHAKGQAPSSDDPIVSIYDVRDLAILFAAAPAPQAISTERDESGAVSPFIKPKPPVTGGVDRLGTLLNNITTAVNASFIQLSPGVFAVTADKDTHTTIRAMLTELRELSRQRYELDLVIYSVNTVAAPALGAAVSIDPASNAVRSRTPVLRRRAEPIEAVTRIAYISDWQPVVAENAVGNDPSTNEVVSGLTCVAMVGAGPDSAESVNFQLTGRMTRATVDPSPIGSGKATTASGPASEGLGIGLPKVDDRSINVDIPLSLTGGSAGGGRLTAVAVLPGFQMGESLVVAAAVRELK